MSILLLNFAFTFSILSSLVEVLDFLMGYESCLRKRRISVPNGPYKLTGKHRHSLCLFHLSLVYSLVYSYLYVVFEFESSRRFQSSFTNFSLVYRSAFAQIFPRSMRESKTFNCFNSKSTRSARCRHNSTLYRNGRITCVLTHNGRAKLEILQAVHFCRV
jgi:hypothetical protein